MLKKIYSKDGKSCKVTFIYPAEGNATSVSLLGEFNNWDRLSLPMKKMKDGTFTVTVSLNSGKQYRFRYLLDETRWDNDWGADFYVLNQFGSEDSIVEV